MKSTPVNVQGIAPVTAMFGASKIQETNGDFSKIFENQKNAASDVDKADFADDFQDNKLADKADEVNQESLAETGNVQAKKESTSVQKDAEAQSDKSATDKDMAEDGLNAEELEKAAEVLQSAVTDIKEMLMQELGLSEDELNALMQEMNLTDGDLLQMSNLKDMLLQLANEQDMAAVLTNEELYGQLQSLEKGFSEVMESVQDALGVSAEEVSKLVDETMNAQDFLNGKISVNMTEEVKVVQTENLSNEADTSEQKSQGEEANAFDSKNAFAPQNAFATQNNVQVAATQTTTSTFYSNVETQNIMNQIMDYMNIHMDAENTEVNMQLQPESLGTLQIRISAKEGIMTAQFTTASEAVKSVLESQLVMLQQQFDQQNIKVEAIEVTVQTHQFESALEKGNEQQGAEENGKKNRTRKIDLTRLDDGEEIAAEDQLVAEMMAANGNSVDYLA